MKFQAVKLIEGETPAEANKVKNGLDEFDAVLACGAWIKADRLDNIYDFIKWTKDFIPKKYQVEVKFIAHSEFNSIGWKYFPAKRTDES